MIYKTLKTRTCLRSFLFGILLPIAAITATSSQAQAKPASVAAEADRFNETGKEFFKERRYLDAYRNFKQATALSPQGKYFFNLCFSLNYLERFEEAIEACEQVVPNGADAKLRDKTNAVLKALREKVPAKPVPPVGPVPPPVGPNPPPVGPNPPPVGPNPPPVGPNTPPVGPNTPPVGPNTGTPPPSGPVTIPGFDPFAAKKEQTTDYKWAAAVSLAPVANFGLGELDARNDIYGQGARINFIANFLYRPEQQLGLQGLVGVTSLSAKDPQFESDLTIINLGVGMYKHFKVTDNIEVTPLVGLQLAAMQPDSDSDEALVAVGGRLQTSVDYILGANREHVLSFSPTLNLYGAAQSGTTLMAETFGLDHSSATFEVGFAYQYRFTSSFGNSPLFSLE